MKWLNRFRYFLPNLHGYFLRRRWKDEEKRIDAIISHIKNGKDWTIFLVKAPSVHKFEKLSTGISKEVPILYNDFGPPDHRSSFEEIWE